jgi:hypothetical protein
MVAATDRAHPIPFKDWGIPSLERKRGPGRCQTPSSIRAICRAGDGRQRERRIGRSVEIRPLLKFSREDGLFGHRLRRATTPPRRRSESAKTLGLEKEPLARILSNCALTARSLACANFPPFQPEFVLAFLANAHYSAIRDEYGRPMATGADGVSISQVRVFCAKSSYYPQRPLTGALYVSTSQRP